MAAAAVTRYAVWSRDLCGNWDASGSAHYADRNDARAVARLKLLERWDNARRCTINCVIVAPVGQRPVTEPDGFVRLVAVK